MTKHTSEPWTVVKAKRPDNTGGYDYAIADSDDNIIAEVFQNVGYADKEKKIYNQRPAKANAHLMAASPEMFATLKAIAGLKITRELENRIYSAIAQAEGK